MKTETKQNTLQSIGAGMMILGVICFFTPISPAGIGIALVGYSLCGAGDKQVEMSQ